MLRLYIIDYRNNFCKLTPNSQIAAAKRIRDFFLLSNSIFRVNWPEINPFGIDFKINLIIDKVNQTIDTPGANTFDILGYLAFIHLEKFFSGEFSESEETMKENYCSVGFLKYFQIDLDIYRTYN